MMPGVDKVTAFCCAFVRAAVTARKALIMPRSKSRKTEVTSDIKSATVADLPVKKSRPKKEYLPLDVAILRAFNEQSMLHIDDIARAAIQCEPMPTPEEIKAFLDRLIDRGWLQSLPGFWFMKADQSVQPSTLMLSPNKQERKALESIKKIHFKNADLAYVAHFVLLIALQHPRQITTWCNALV